MPPGGARRPGSGHLPGIAPSSTPAAGIRQRGLRLYPVPVPAIWSRQRDREDRSVLSASTDTTFYAIAVYFGACGVKKLSYTVPAALLGDRSRPGILRPHGKTFRVSLAPRRPPGI